MPWSPSPNPTGINGSEDSAYGAVKAATEQIQQAPLPANRAIATPKRAQRAAQRPTAPTSAPAAPLPPQVFPAAPAPDYRTQVAQVYADLAAEPDASPFVRQLAIQAQGGG
jgi:hypothetical protein